MDETIGAMHDMPAPDDDTEIDPALEVLRGQSWKPSLYARSEAVVMTPLVWFVITAYIHTELESAWLYRGAFPGSEHVMDAMIVVLGLLVLRALWKAISLKATHYRFEITGPRDAALVVRRGVLNRHESNLELMRIRDVELAAPLALRMVRRANLCLVSEDRSDPVLYLEAIEHGRERLAAIKSAVRAHQRVCGYREAGVS